MDGLTPITNMKNFQATDSMVQGHVNPGSKSSVTTHGLQGTMEGFIKTLQAVLSSTDVSVGFSKYGENKTAVIVYNKETGNVIREIPPKEIQRLESTMEEMIGIIFNHTA